MLIKVRNDKSARRGSIELFNRCVSGCEDKVQFLHSQDTQPVKKLDASSPGRLVIPDFNQHSSTIEVKELTPPPTKAEKRKPQEWITQVATQEEVRSEPPLQANRLSADKVQFLHSQDTQPVKRMLPSWQTCHSDSLISTVPP